MKKHFLILLCLILLLPAQPSLQGGAVDDAIVPTFVFVGDSNTATSEWYNGSYVTKLVDYGEPWVNVKRVNSGQDGWGAFSYYLEPSRIQAKITQHNPRYVLIALGGNDFLLLQDPDRFRRDYHHLIDGILEQNQTIQHVFLANIYWGTLQVSDELRRIYEQYQEVIYNSSVLYGFPLVDFFNSTVNHPEYYQDDMIHLNEAGHRAVADKVNQVIAPVVSADFSENNISKTVYLDTSTASSQGSASEGSSEISSETAELVIYHSIMIIPVLGLLRRSYCS